MVDRGEHYFLSRPRRFGKSLLLDTLHELFAGSEPLFRGLAIHDRWDWSRRHPVLRLSFDGKHSEPGDLEADVLVQLGIAERNAGLAPESDAPASGPARLRSLLDRLHRQAGERVVVLVDEYDKPILDVLDNAELARANREYLRGFYGVVKGSARAVRFVFVTGVSMFTKVSLFSGLNNLENISLDSRYATICGYTDADIDTVFAPELKGLDRAEVRRWYNGYHWLGGERLYNPYDVLLLFRSRQFEAHWFETGTPDVLYHLMAEGNLDSLELENRPVAARRLSRSDVDDIDVRALMFQAGYLTIAGEERRGTESFHTLAFPNLEVRQSFNQDLLAHLGQDEDETSRWGHDLLQLLASNDFDGFGEWLRSHLAGIPHQWYDRTGMERFEAHYAALLYMTLCAVGAEVRAEESSARGRADMVLLHSGQTFVLQFKMVGEGEKAEAALDQAMGQMRERGYADKHRSRGGPVHLVAVAFGRGERNLLAVRAERL